MNLTQESTAMLADLRRYLSAPLADLYFRLIFQAASGRSVRDTVTLEAGQVLLEVGEQTKTLRISRSTLYYRLARLTEIGLLHMARTSKNTIITVLAFALPGATPSQLPMIPQVPPPLATKKKPKPKIYPEDGEPMRLSRLLFQFMALRLTSIKEPNFQSWAKDMDLLLRVDGRSFEEAEKVLRFSQKNTFWQRNILSPAKLRAQYDRLQMEMKNEVSSPNRNPGIRSPSYAERKAERLQQALARFA